MTEEKHSHTEHPEHHSHAVHHEKKLNAWMIVSVILAIALVAVAGLALAMPKAQTSTTNGTQLSQSELNAVGQKAFDYLNKNSATFWGTGVTVSLKSVTEKENKPYITLELKNGTQTKTLNVYVLDGNKLFLSDTIDTALQIGQDLGAAATANTDTTGTDTTAQTQPPKTDKPKAALFVMSFCPYGIQAEEALAPVVNLLGSTAQILPNYIPVENFCGWGVLCKCAQGVENGKCKENQAYSEDPTARKDFCFDANETVPKYCTLHGVGEINEDLRQICIRENQPEKLWNYISYIAAKYDAQQWSPANIDSKWQEAATAAGIDTAKVTQCYNSNPLAKLAAEKAIADSYGVQGSPTLVINDTTVSPDRTPNAFKTAICSAFTTAPADCNKTLDSTGAASGNKAGCGPTQ